LGTEIWCPWLIFREATRSSSRLLASAKWLTSSAVETSGVLGVICSVGSNRRCRFESGVSWQSVNRLSGEVGVDAGVDDDSGGDERADDGDAEEDEDSDRDREDESAGVVVGNVVAVMLVLAVMRVQVVAWVTML